MVRQYQHITDAQRKRLVELIESGSSIVRAANEVGINYENAKAINRIFKQEQRAEKKKTRKTRRTKECQNAEEEKQGTSEPNDRTQDPTTGASEEKLAEIQIQREPSVADISPTIPIKREGPSRLSMEERPLAI